VIGPLTDEEDNPRDVAASAAAILHIDYPTAAMAPRATRLTDGPILADRR